MENNKKKTLAIVLSIFAITIVIGATYAFVTRTLTGTKKVTLTAGTLSLVLDEKNAITISDALPMYDQVGMMQEEVFEFDLINNTTNPTDYTLKLQKVSTANELSTSDVKYYLTKDGVGTPALLSTLTDGVVDTGTIEGNDTIEYTLRLWISDAVTDNNAISGKSLSYRIDVEASMAETTGTAYQDESGANVPQLTSGMIPVVYNEGNWVKADTSEAWYDYETQMWANAVTVTESSRDTYMAAEANTPIAMADINTMWVWIPRYEYQYTDLGTSYAGGTQAQPGEIKINFISSDTLTPSDSNTYKIPEGFKFGEENIPGFWMGKFETSTLESCIVNYNSINTDCDLTTLTPQIKPGVTSWRGARVSTFFEASRLMQSSDNTLNYNADTYGFDTVGTSSMDSHMLKNTEWGIVAMLSQSKYGKYGNTKYTGVDKEVYQNKSDTYITGMSNGTPSQSTTNIQVAYDTPDTGYGASTTGTIYGVYDMSGGASEYVMGNYNNVSGYSNTGNSGFCGTNGPIENCREWPNSKYFDLYTSGTSSDAYKFGDGTYETSGWYSDNAYFVGSSNPWFARGGYYNNGTYSGVFNSDIGSGKSAGNASRFVIKP